MTMTDRELLEGAAKAAGAACEEIDGEFFCWSNCQPWNPLIDDGDALRLAVRCHIDIEIWNVDNVVRANVVIDGWPRLAVERYTEDACKATRRAIVKAAAAIGNAA